MIKSSDYTAALEVGRACERAIDRILNELDRRREIVAAHEIELRLMKQSVDLIEHRMEIVSEQIGQLTSSIRRIKRQCGDWMLRLQGPALLIAALLLQSLGGAWKQIGDTLAKMVKSAPFG